MTKTSRRQFLGAAASGGSALVWGQPTPKDRPNILFAVADDQSWLHTSSAGDRVVKTPNIDGVANGGVRFTHSFCCSPSCTPSRGGVLTGQEIWRLEAGGNLWSALPKKFEVYPDLLEAAGYHVGMTRKGWGPGNFEAGGWPRNPAGPHFNNFDEFLKERPSGRPFCFWFGSTDPHRPFELGQGVRSGLKLDDVVVPPWLPDSPEVRSDILDYYWKVQRFDRDLGQVLEAIRKAGEIENTLVVVTSDNGMPFPRAKTNLYDSGTRMPLAISWPARIPGARVVDDFVSHADFAPTFLEAAGLKPRPAMTGRSLLPLLLSKKRGRVEAARSRVFTARERHTNMSAEQRGYPMRSLRTYDHLYVRNFAPDRWPSGDPEHYGDIDNGPSKEFVIENRDNPKFSRFYDLACAKRPAEELYDLKKDPAQLVNVAGDPGYAAALRSLRSELDTYLKQTGDPRLTGAPVIWDTAPYYGASGAQLRRKKQ